jgi:hypothetical protein
MAAFNVDKKVVLLVLIFFFIMKTEVLFFIFIFIFELFISCALYAIRLIFFNVKK